MLTSSEQSSIDENKKYSRSELFCDTSPSWLFSARSVGWFLSYGARNSARVFKSDLKTPPKAVVWVWELVSMTPLALTQ